VRGALPADETLCHKEKRFPVGRGRTANEEKDAPPAGTRRYANGKGALASRTTRYAKGQSALPRGKTTLCQEKRRFSYWKRTLSATRKAQLRQLEAQLSTRNPLPPKRAPIGPSTASASLQGSDAATQRLASLAGTRAIGNVRGSGLRRLESAKISASPRATIAMPDASRACEEETGYPRRRERGNTDVAAERRERGTGPA